MNTAVFCQGETPSVEGCSFLSIRKKKSTARRICRGPGETISAIQNRIGGFLARCRLEYRMQRIEKWRKPVAE
jgi:hypothetical protein